MPETVLVTGGTGFVAKWVIVELLNKGYAVRTTIRDARREADVRAGVAAMAEADDKLEFFTADLLRDDGWDAATAGCDYVLHVASPLGTGEALTDREAFVKPASEGTLRVLRASVKASVKRVVMTSAAATARPPLDSGRISDETIWADPNDRQFDFYRISKILAERAAWDFMKSEGGSTEFATILPGAVFGPVLPKEGFGSVRIIKGLLDGHPRAMPQLGFWVVDVRDLAHLHLSAMTAPQAAGERFIAASAFMWMHEIAETLRNGLGSAAARVPTHRLPTFLVRLLPLFVPQFRSLAPMVGRKFLLTSEKARKVLGFSPRPAEETIIDCARSLLEIASRH